MQLIVAITGASGIVYGKRLLEMLGEKEVETHLVVTRAAEKVAKHELGVTREDLEKLVDHVYDEDYVFAPIVSGSFKTDGMVIIPCSMKTLAGIAHGYAQNIVLRAADVMLKEKRRLILVPRETPLGIIHLQNMLELARNGVSIIPAMPAFYHHPESIEDLVDFVVGKVLDCLGIEHQLFRRWLG